MCIQQQKQQHKYHYNAYLIGTWPVGGGLSLIYTHIMTLMSMNMTRMAAAPIAIRITMSAIVMCNQVSWTLGDLDSIEII